MSEIVTLVLTAIGQLAKIATEAAANAALAEAEVLARLRVVLTTSAAQVDARLAQLEEARRRADGRIAAGAPAADMTTPHQVPPGGGSVP
jgi:hypothetical protein